MGRLSRLVIAAVATGMLLHACKSDTPTPADASSLQVRRLALVGEDGRELAVLSVGEDGRPSLVFKDTLGHDRISLGVYADEVPLIALYGPNLQEAISLKTLRGAPALSVRNKVGERRALLTTNEDGAPHLTLFDSSAKPRSVLGAVSITSRDTEETETRPVSSLVLMNKFGEITFQAPPKQK